MATSAVALQMLKPVARSATAIVSFGPNLGVNENMTSRSNKITESVTVLS